MPLSKASAMLLYVIERGVRGSKKNSGPRASNDLLDPGWVDPTAKTSLIPQVTWKTLIWFGLTTRGDFPDIH